MADILYSTGKASIPSSTSSFTLYGAGFLPGFNIFPTKSGVFQPYFGASAIVAWNLIKLASPPADVDANTQGLTLGYEIRAGIDWRPGRADGQAIRIQSSLYTASGSLAGVSGLQVNGFRLGLGLNF